MVQFEDLMAIKGRGSLLDDLEPLPSLPNGPSEYAEFLQLIGFGALTDGSLCLYSGLIHPKELFGPGWEGPELKVFGDDMAGTCFAFRGPDDAVVSFQADGCVPGLVADGFGAFLRSYLPA